VSLGVFRLIPIRLSNRDGPTRVSHPVARVKIFKTTPGQSIQVYEVAFSRKLVRGSLPGHPPPWSCASEAAPRQLVSGFLGAAPAGGEGADRSGAGSLRTRRLDLLGR
jgi:hypothetical protein